jgi:serine/threonine protein kinase
MSLANLQHSNIVKIYDFGLESNIPYVIMEYFGGQDLGRRDRQFLPISR